jgi:magnesium chelatase subunit D
VNSSFPFSAVVGQDAAKLALLLAAGEPLLGGVLLRGDKGSAKTTLARGLSALLPGRAPFVELPLGATEDRVLGSVELASLLSGEPKVRLGLLASAHGGVLYVDEINLLADHLIDALLDVAVSGVNRIERDGISHTHPARFVLIGSMNPEEGELRPQLLDRFGFAVDVRAEDAVALRKEVVTRRLAFEADPGSLAAFHGQDEVLSARLSALARRAPSERPVLPERVIEQACRVALAVGAEGLRADLMLCRGGSAHAAFHGQSEVSLDDVQAVAGFVLAHRRRRSPLEPPGISDSALDQAFDKAREPEPSVGESDATERDAEQPAGANQRFDRASAPLAPPPIRIERARSEVQGKRGSNEAHSGRFVRAERLDSDNAVGASLAAVATLQAVAARRSSEPGAALAARDLHVAVRKQKTGHLVILCVDTSGSMGVEARMALAKGAALGLLTDAYQRRDRVALVTFAGDRAETVLRPTASVEIAQARLAALPTGGNSPIAEGLDAAYHLAHGASGDQRLHPLLVLITDGRATGSDDAVGKSLTSARRFAEAQIPAVVIDVEAGPVRLHLAHMLAEVLGAPCLPIDQLEQGSLEAAIRLRLA